MSERLKRLLGELAKTSVDEYPHSRVATRAADLVAEWRAWERKEYPYDKPEERT